MSHACKCPCRPEVSGCLTLDLQAILSHLTWVLGTELESPLRVVCTLNCWPSLCCFYLVLVCVKPQVTHSLPLITHTTTQPASLSQKTVFPFPSGMFFRSTYSFILHSTHALTGLHLDCTADLYSANLLLCPATLSITDECSSFLLRHRLCPSRPCMSSAVGPQALFPEFLFCSFSV